MLMKKISVFTYVVDQIILKTVTRNSDGFPSGSVVKKLPAMQETWVQSLDWENPLEKEKASHSSILASRIPCTVWIMGSQRVRHD